jgi:hypothetical protein
MPRTCIDTADAIEFAETLQLIASWLTAHPQRLAASLLDFIGHPAYGPDALHADMDRFTFLLGGNDGEFLLGDDPDLPRHPAETAVKTREQKSPAQPPTAVRSQNSRTKPQPLEELSQRSELVAGVGGAVPAEQPGNPPLHVLPGDLFPASAIGLR